MEIVIIKSLHEYKKFIHELYVGDECFKDNKSGLLPIVCCKKSAFYKNSIQKMVAVKEGERTLCQAIFIRHKNAMNIVSVAFFEALPDQQEAVDMLVRSAEEFAAQVIAEEFAAQKNVENCEKAEKIIFGLDGHCNNGVGFGTSGRGFPTFGESYNKEYYQGYFKEFDEIGFVSYIGSIGNAEEQIKKDTAFLKNRNSGNGIVFEFADFNPAGFTRTMKRYTDLNNKIFTGQRYYFKREYEEDHDLFHAMRPLLKNENMIFARKDNMDIGFILWYPDFNEFAEKGRGAGISTFIRYRLLAQSPKKAKVVEIGLTEGQKNSALILLLFAKAIESAEKYKKMDTVMSSWILDENGPSKNITQRYTNDIYKRFAAYEKNI